MRPGREWKDQPLCSGTRRPHSAPSCPYCVASAKAPAFSGSEAGSQTWEWVHKALHGLGLLTAQAHTHRAQPRS